MPPKGRKPKSKDENQMKKRNLNGIGKKFYIVCINILFLI